MIDIAPNERSMRLLNQAMKAADHKTSKTSSESGRKAAYFICRSLAVQVKPKSMATKRDIIRNPERTGRGRRARGSKFLIKVLKQGGRPTMIPTNNRTDRRRKIVRLGLAASSFRVAAGKFGKKIGGKRVRDAGRHSKGYWRTSRANFTARIESFLSYVPKVFPNAADAAIKKGLASFIRTFDRDWATALKGT